MVTMPSFETLAHFRYLYCYRFRHYCRHFRRRRHFAMEWWTSICRVLAGEAAKF